MDWEINLKNKDKYFPRTERWIMDSFGLNAERAMIYQMILNKGFITWSLGWMGEVLGCSRDKVKDTLKLFCDMEIITRRTINVQESGVRMRTVYVALYTIDGKRSDDEIEYLLSQGIYKLSLEYGVKKTYKKRK